MFELFMSLMIMCESADCFIANTQKNVVVIMCVDEPVGPSTVRNYIKYVDENKTLFVHVDNCISL